VRRKWRPERSKIFCDLFQIGVWKKFEQVIHRRVSAAPVPECHQLIVEIAGGFSRKPREINVAGALTLRAMTRCASENTCRRRIGSSRARLSRLGLRSPDIVPKRNVTATAPARWRLKQSRTSPGLKEAR
jgi:hypothetical protein